MRQPGDPIVSDDRVRVPSSATSWRTVQSFTYNGPSGRVLPNEANDECQVSLNVNDIEDIPYPVLKGCPQQLTGIPAVERVKEPIKVRLPPEQRQNLENFLRSANEKAYRKDGREIRVWDFMEKLTTLGYDVWVAGGAVRDVLRGDKPPNDADLAGTVPFGAFCQSLEDMVERLRLYFTINADKSVLHIFDQEEYNGEVNCILDYAFLKYSWQKERTRFRFDHMPSNDVVWRDLTINSLYCIPMKRGHATEAENIALDLTALGVQDVASKDSRITLRVIGLPPSYPPGLAASRLLRLLRFAYFKYKEEADVSPLPEFKEHELDECCEDFKRLNGVEKEKLIKKSFFKDEPYETRSLEEACNLLGLQFLWRELFQSVLK